MNDLFPATTLTQDQVKAANEQMSEWLKPESGEEGRVKAAYTATDYIRVRIREGSIARNILTPQNISQADIYPRLEDDDPSYIGEIEPDTPGAVVTPLADRPESHYFKGKRYEARFGRVHTPRQIKEVAQLLTYKYDLRRILSDMNLKDLLSLEDTRFLRTVNTLLANGETDAQGNLKPQEVLPSTGVIQWDTLNAGIDVSSIADALTVPLRSNLGMKASTALINLNFATQLMKINRNDFGGDIAEEVKRTGFTEREWMGVRWLITIKNWLVPDGTMYMFGPQEFIGKTLILQDATMSVRKDDYMISFWAYELVAQVIANIGAVWRVDLLDAAWPETAS